MLITSVALISPTGANDYDNDNSFIMYASRGRRGAREKCKSQSDNWRIMRGSFRSKDGIIAWHSGVLPMRLGGAL